MRRRCRALQRDAAAILTTPEMKESLLAQGCVADGGSPESFPHGSGATTSSGRK